MKIKRLRGGVTAPEGFHAAGISCGIKKSKNKDFSLIHSLKPAVWAAVLTTSRAPAAPVLLTRALLRRRRPLRAVIVNSGNANSATGEAGMTAAKGVAAAAAGCLGLDEDSVLMASTGIIGEQLPVDLMMRGVPPLAAALSRRGGRAAAEAIMTTDTVPKQAAVELDLGRRAAVRIGGMAKGAGMIEPDMATMLAFVTTDAALSFAQARRLLRTVADATFNRISVDGDCSTNDTLLLLANGAAGVTVREGSREEKGFLEGLLDVCRRLSEMIVADGEGATKFVEVQVTGAAGAADALRAARAVANSSLVKTAWYGEDLNWGRILAALGCSGARIETGKVAITVNGRPAVAAGTVVPPKEFARAQREMKKKNLHFGIDLGLGGGADRIVTCDLSLDYVRINAEYTT